MNGTYARRIAYLLLFAVVLIGGDRLLGWGLDRLTMSSQARYSRLYRGDEAADVVIIGDSRGVHSFYAPAIADSAGQRTLNLSYNGISTELAEAVLADYLDHNKAPRLLVIEVTNFASAPDALVNFKPYFGHSARLRQLFDREQSYTANAMRLIHLYRFNCESFLRAAYYLSRDDQNWILRTQMADALIGLTEQQPPAPLSETTYADLNRAALRRMVQLADERGIELRLVVAPYWPAHREKLANWSEVTQKIRDSIGDKHRLWDYSLAISGPTNFADRVHLNLSGAQEFCARLNRDQFFNVAADRQPPVSSGAANIRQ